MSGPGAGPIAIVGGTGDLGFGLAMRLAASGRPVIIGSRSRDRGGEAAERVRTRLAADAPVEGAENAAAVREVPMVFVTVPYAGQADIYRSIREHLRDGAVVCDTTTPLATAVGGRPTHVLRPWHGSAAEQARVLLPDGVRLVAGFHSVSAEALESVDHDVDADALLCGDDREATASVGALVDLVPGLRWVDCGPLSMARVLEPLTAVLISVNRRYGIRDAGVRMSGHEVWGRPAR